MAHKLIENYMNELTNIFTPAYKKHDLQKFSDQLNTYIRLLKTEGKPVESYQCMLVPVLLKKLPENVIISICKEYGKKEISLQNIIDVIDTCKELIILDRLSASKSVDDGVSAFHTNDVGDGKPKYGHGDKKSGSGEGPGKRSRGRNGDNGGDNQSDSSHIKCNFCAKKGHIVIFIIIQPKGITDVQKLVYVHYV